MWLQYSTCPAEGVSVHSTRAGRMAHFLLSGHRRKTAERTLLRTQCALQQQESLAGGTQEPLQQQRGASTGAL